MFGGDEDPAERNRQQNQQRRQAFSPAAAAAAAAGAARQTRQRLAIEREMEQGLSDASLMSRAGTMGGDAMLFQQALERMRRDIFPNLPPPSNLPPPPTYEEALAEIDEELLRDVDLPPPPYAPKEEL